MIKCLRRATVLFTALTLSLQCGSGHAVASASAWDKLAAGQRATIAGGFLPGDPVRVCAHENDVTLNCSGHDIRFGEMVQILTAYPPNPNWPGYEQEKRVVKIRDSKGIGYVQAAQLVPVLPTGTVFRVYPNSGSKPAIWHRITADEPYYAELSNGSWVRALKQSGYYYNVRVISGSHAGETGWVQCFSACITTGGDSVTLWR